MPGNVELEGHGRPNSRNIEPKVFKGGAPVELPKTRRTGRSNLISHQPPKRELPVDDSCHTLIW